MANYIEFLIFISIIIVTTLFSIIYLIANIIKCLDKKEWT